MQDIPPRPRKMLGGGMSARSSVVSDLAVFIREGDGGGGDGGGGDEARFD